MPLTSYHDAVLFPSRDTVRTVLAPHAGVDPALERAVQSIITLAVTETMRRRWPELIVAVTWIPLGEVTRVEDRTRNPEVARTLLTALRDAAASLRGRVAPAAPGDAVPAAAPLGG